MKKYNVTEEDVLAEAAKMNMEINREHFIVPENEGVKRGRPKSEKVVKEKGVKGRPKKEKKVVTINEDSVDLFETLVAEANKSEHVVEEKVEEKKEEKAAKKAAEKALAQQKKEEKAKEREAKRLAEKAEKEAKLAAEKAAKLAEKEAKLAEKAALAEKKKAEKEQKKSTKKQDTGKSEEVEEEVAEEVAEEAPKEIKVKTILFEGKKYLLSKSTNIVYDHKSFTEEGEQVMVGKWSDSLKKILFDDAEESEEEYDEESEDEVDDE
jgi:hypothetical protein